LADEAHPHVAWLQSLADPDVALAAISPRQLVPGYKLRVNRRQLACLDLRPETPVHVLIVLAKNAGQLTVNLRAPVLLNLERGLGCQIVTVDDQPVRHALADFSAQLYRRSA
jgi:flagellar assembly factor FliW